MVLKRSGGSYGYIDGSLVATTTDLDSSSFNFNFTRASLAYVVPAFANDYDGSLDDVGVWGKALKPEEILELLTGVFQN